MKLHRTTHGVRLEHDDAFFPLAEYDGACALGPALLVREAPLPSETIIAIAIHRDGQLVFQGETALSQMRRAPEELVEHLYRETSFPLGCMLLTGTGVVPPADFTLARGDRVAIHVEPIGSLVNTVE